MIRSEQPSQTRLGYWCSKMSYGNRSDLGTFVLYSEKRLGINPINSYLFGCLLCDTDLNILVGTKRKSQYVKTLNTVFKHDWSEQCFTLKYINCLLMIQLDTVKVNSAK